MPNPKQTMMEDMSIAFVRALCAANGYSISSCEHDNDGFDMEINCKDKAAPDSHIVSCSFQAQLKSSYGNIKLNPDGSISYNLEVKNYRWLIQTNRMTPLILIVFHMPADENQWLEQTTDWLKIKKCAYWISLSGKPDTLNENTISIRIPANNVLTKDSLKDIMVKVSKQLPL